MFKRYVNKSCFAGFIFLALFIPLTLATSGHYAPLYILMALFMIGPLICLPGRMRLVPVVLMVFVLILAYMDYLAGIAWKVKLKQMMSLPTTKAHVPQPDSRP